MDNCLNSGNKNIYLFKEFNKFTTDVLIKVTNKGHKPPEHLFFDLCSDLLEKQTSLLDVFNRQLLYLQMELFNYVQQEMQTRKDSANIQSFDDLLLKLHKALVQKGGDILAQKIRGKYLAALIDEFQDTDPVQYEIFKNIFHNHRILFLIGDPKQAIYGFRGADIFAYMSAKQDSKYAYTLGYNWRSEPGLITAVNTLFQSSDQAFIYGEIPFEPVTSPENRPGKKRLMLSLDQGEKIPLQLWIPESEKLTDSSKVLGKGIAEGLIVKAVAGEISRLLDLGKQGRVCIDNNPVLPGDIAVLVRKNSEAKMIQDALLNLGIPGVVYSTGDIFDTHEALEIERIMAAAANPRHERLMRSALATDMLGLKGHELFELAEDEDAWEKWLIRFKQYSHIWETRGFIHMFKYFILRENVLPRLMSLADGERRATNILHLSELIHQAGIEKKTGLSGLVKWLSEQRTRKDRRPEEHPLRLESDDNAVKLVTIHKSKGLEYPIVFCPFTWGGAKNYKSKDPVLFHDEENNRSLTFDIGSEFIDKNRSYAVKEELAENLRLLYVALTRARNRCYLVWGRFNKSETSAPAYLFHSNISGTDDIITTTVNKYKSLNDETLGRELEQIQERSRGTINLSVMPDKDGLVFTPGSNYNNFLNCRNFKGSIINDFRVSSFSSLVSGQHYRAELADYDELDETRNNIKEIESEPGDFLPPDPLSFFAFPRGAKPGTCIHEIFEYLDFTEKNLEVIEKLVKEKLDKYGFETSWTAGICHMIQNVLSIPLLKDQNLTLSRISGKDRINELEFYFPLNAVSCEDIKTVFAGNKMPEFSKQMAQLTFSRVQGFMKGYIDLVFQFNGKFYLADWKSNFMGENYQDYSQDNIYRKMRESFYILQYHIYTLALHQYLKTRISDYDYNKHFGGVFYLFLRGIDPAAGNRYGIFFDRPDRELIISLSKKLMGMPSTKSAQPPEKQPHNA
ncbi:Exodeoxyribonuclease V, subunit beta [Desulfonema limicola]|uniref:DNA 3'-5' helicase n=1 Tax=Desulfonema limicola TaxID=45656 RepID=A0A975GF62_9BACT|nr:exodeoxyribonuclease V subunit beta [Desulfonema limicola]QTA78913.1 Exodeoxyribonuclease V, subunit beta [Desulfonema limicola]